MLANLTNRTKLRMTGADRERYLGGQVTNDLALHAERGTLEACICNAKGKLEAHVHITATEDAYLIDAAPDFRQDDLLLNRLNKYIIADDCEAEDISDQYDLFHFVEGPAPPNDPNTIVSPSSRFGSDGADYWTPAGTAPTDLAFTAESELETFRIAHGIPRWGTELTPVILPPEAGPEFIERNISYTKGCYIGQEVISRIRSVGKVNKQLVALRAVDEKAALEPGLELYTENSEKPVGVLTSCAAGPSIALAYVKSAYIGHGTKLTAGTEEKPLAVAVEISKTPLILRPSEP